MVPSSPGDLLFAGRIEHRIVEPGVDRGFAPAGTTGADLNVLRERAVLHLPVHCRAAEAGAFENGLDPENAVGGVDLHWYHLA